MKTQTIYISGKITGAPNLNIHKFSAAEEFLKQFAYVVLNPHTLRHWHDKKWWSYMRVCLREMCSATQVVVLDDWKYSRGAKIEVLVARWLNIPVLEIETMSELKIGFFLKVKILISLI